MKINKLINVSLVSLCALGLAMVGANTHADDKDVVNNASNKVISNSSKTGSLYLNSINGIKASDLDITKDGNVNAPVSLSNDNITANFNNFTGTNNYSKWSLSVNGGPLTNDSNNKTVNAVIDLGNNKTINLDGSKNSTPIFNNTGIAEGKGTSLTIAKSPTMHVTDKSLPQDPNTTNTYSTTLNWNLGATNNPSNPGKQ